jgi:hypothetical protein
MNFITDMHQSNSEYYSDLKIKDHVFENSMTISILHDIFNRKKHNQFAQSPDVELLLEFQKKKIMSTNIFSEFNIFEFKLKMEELKRNIKIENLYDKIDTLIIHYSGHGCSINNKNEQVMAFRSTSSVYKIKSKYDNYNIIEYINFQIVSMFKHLKLLVIVNDSCRVGKSYPGVYTMDDSILSKTSIVYIHGTKYDQAVMSTRNDASYLTLKFFDKIQKLSSKKYLKIDDIIEAIYNIVKFDEEYKKMSELVDVDPKTNEAESWNINFVVETKSDFGYTINKMIEDINKIAQDNSPIKRRLHWHILKKEDLFKSDVENIFKHNSSYLRNLENLVYKVAYNDDDEYQFMDFDWIVDRIYNNEKNVSEKEIKLEDERKFYIDKDANITIYDEYMNMFKLINNIDDRYDKYDAKNLWRKVNDDLNEKENITIVDKFMRIKHIFTLHELVDTYNRLKNKLILNLIDENILYDHALTEWKLYVNDIFEYDNENRWLPSEDETIKVKNNLIVYRDKINETAITKNEIYREKSKKRTTFYKELKKHDKYKSHLYMFPDYRIEVQIYEIIKDDRIDFHKNYDWEDSTLKDDRLSKLIKFLKYANAHIFISELVEMYTLMLTGLIEKYHEDHVKNEIESKNPEKSIEFDDNDKKENQEKKRQKINENKNSNSFDYTFEQSFSEMNFND